MSEVKTEKKRAREFAGLIANIMEPLSERPKFKEKFKKTNRKFVINATNLNFAALITIKEGTLKVESVPNKPKENLKKKKLGWDGFVSMDTTTFLRLAMRRITPITLGIKLLMGKVKIRGVRKLFGLLSLMKMLEE